MFDYDYSEVDEMVDAVTWDLSAIKTVADAEVALTRQMGPPSELGYTIHANAVDALLDRAERAQRR